MVDVAELARDKVSDMVASETAIVRLEGLSKTFQRADGSTVPAIDNISLDIDAGEFVVLLGPSGCGKTTLLRCIAGLETPDEGTIQLHGREVFRGGRRVVPPEKRGLGMVFQSYALWPHRTVFENVAYPLRSQRVPSKEVTERVRSILSTVGIAELEHQHPGQLSGGQQQRVALARACVSGSRVLLFDEPLSNVDAKVRDQLRGELVDLQSKLGFTALYVTHDQQEAMALADRVAVLNAGRVEQLASPREVYQRPASRYVADFIGVTNELTGQLASSVNDVAVVDTDLGRFEVADAPDGAAPGSAVSIISRPEHWSFGKPALGSITLTGTVVQSTYLGPHVEYVVDVDGWRLRVWESNTDHRAVGGRVDASVEARWLRLLAR